MAHGRQCAEWERASWIMAVVRNSAATKRSQTIQPRDVNPMVKRRRMSQAQIKANRKAVYDSLVAKGKVES